MFVQILVGVANFLHQGIDKAIDDFGNYNSNKVDGYNFTNWGGNSDYSSNGSGPHGNLVAGVIGAIRNNSIKIAGIAGGNSANSNDIGVKLYGMKISSPTGVASSETLSDAIVGSSLGDASWDYGWGLDILNIAYNAYIGYDTDGNVIANSPFYGISEALHFANRCQVTTVISSGNSGVNYVQAPANVEDDWVIAVGGSDVDGQYNNYSYGSQTDITASSDGSALSITNVASTASFNGTSSASSHVSGAAALLISYLNSPTPNDDNLAPEDIELWDAFSVDSATPSGNTIGFFHILDITMHNE